VCVCHLVDDHGEGAGGGGGEVHDGGGAAAGGVGHAAEEGAVVPGHHRRGYHRRAAGGVRVTIGLRLRRGVVAQDEADADADAAAGARGRVHDEGSRQVLLRRPRLPGQPPASRACAGVAQGRSLKRQEGAVSLFGRSIYISNLYHFHTCAHAR